MRTPSNGGPSYWVSARAETKSPGTTNFTGFTNEKRQDRRLFQRIESTNVPRVSFCVEDSRKTSRNSSRPTSEDRQGYTWRWKLIPLKDKICFKKFLCCKALLSGSLKIRFSAFESFSGSLSKTRWPASKRTLFKRRPFKGVSPFIKALWKENFLN